MTNSKRHHYLPECYLKGFCDDGMIWVYNREINQYKPQTPHDTAVEGQRYSFIDIDGKNNRSIENNLLAKIDDWYIPLISKIDKSEGLTDEDKDKLSLFVSYMWFRVPDCQKQFNELADGMSKHFQRFIYSSGEEGRQYHERILRENPAMGNISFEEIKKSVKENESPIVPHKNEYLKSMMKMGLEIADLFRQMEWIFFHPVVGSAFICTDSPVVLGAPKDYDANSFYGVGIITPGATKLIPLSKISCMIMLDHGDTCSHYTVGQDQVRRTNLVLAVNCDRYMYSSSRNLLASLVKRTGIANTKKGKRIRMH